MKKLLSSKYSIVFFIILFIGMCFLYRYQKILTDRPTSIHQHRQCDCLSFAFNYYKCNNNFFEPQVNYKSGKYYNGRATSELPIIHYVVAQLWKVFGYHEWIYRFFVLLIMFSGLLALFKVFQYILNDTFWQIILPLWLFSSPILVYYGNNFLAHVPGMSFAFIGWYFFTRYAKKQKLINLVVVFVFFCLAMLIKLTSGISFLAFIGLFLFEWIKTKKNNEKALFQKPWITLSLILSVCVIVLSWYLYAVFYNKSNLGPDHAQLFLTGILPIWDLPISKIILISRIIFDYQVGNYFNLIGLLTVLTFFIIVLLNYKKQNRRLLIINIIVFLSFIGGMALWFQVYDVHDYYLINYLIFIPASCLTFFKYIQTAHPQIFTSLKLKIPILLVVLFCIYWGYAKIDARYGEDGKKDYTYSSFLSRHEVDNYMYSHWAYAQQIKAFETITPYLRSIGITEKDLVFSFPDPSLNITLYLMGQWGIPIPAADGIVLLKYLSNNKSLGIKYLILGDSTLLHDDIIKKVLSKKIGEYQTVSIYDISKLQFAYNKFSCNAEVLDADNKFFKGTSDTVKFANNNLRTGQKSHSGKYSVCLDEYNKYGFSTKIPAVSSQQIIKVSVWRYSDRDSDAGICLSAENPQDLYIGNSKTESGTSEGWQQISVELRIPAIMNGKNLSVYVFNPDKGKKVYFDDIEISILYIPK